MSVVLFVARAFDVGVIMPNAVQYIQKVFLTSDGSNSWTTGITLDGTTNGGITITNLPSKPVLGTDANGKLIASTSGDVYNYIHLLLGWSQWATWAMGLQWPIWATWAQWLQGIQWLMGLPWAKWETWAKLNYTRSWTSISFELTGGWRWPYTNLQWTGWLQWITWYSVVLNIVQVWSGATSGQCASTANVVSFYADVNYNFVYDIWDHLLWSTIICSAWWVGPKWDTWPAWATWAKWDIGLQWVAWATWAKWDIGLQWVAWATWAKWDIGLQWPVWADWPAWTKWSTGYWFASFLCTSWQIPKFNWSAWVCGDDLTWESALWTMNGHDMYNDNRNIGNIGIWLMLPTYKLTLSGDMLFDQTSSRMIKMQDMTYVGRTDFSIIWSTASGWYNSDMPYIWWHIYIQAWTWGKAIATYVWWHGWNVYINGWSYWYTNGIYGQVIMANNGGKVAIATSQATAMLTVEGGIRPIWLNTNKDLGNDPCYSNPSDYPIGTMFYSTSADTICYCNSSNVAKTTAWAVCN